MTLYRVQVTYNAVVVAKDEFEAERIAKRAECFFDTEKEAIADAITSAEDLPPPWDANCTPYGGDDDTTIGGILKQ